MNTIIKYLNFIGILALAALCASQWKSNSSLNDRLISSRHLADDQAAKIISQETQLKQDTGDLNDLHQRLTLSESQTTAAQTALKKASMERDQLRQQCDRLVEGITQRDQIIKQQNATASDVIRKLESERDQADAKFNDLATKYNAMIVAQKAGNN